MHEKHERMYFQCTRKVSNDPNRNTDKGIHETRDTKANLPSQRVKTRLHDERQTPTGCLLPRPLRKPENSLETASNELCVNRM